MVFGADGLGANGNNHPTRCMGCVLEKLEAVVCVDHNQLCVYGDIYSLVYRKIEVTACMPQILATPKLNVK